MSDKVSRVYGDNSPINFIVRFDGIGPIDLSAYTVKITIEQDDGTAVVTAATTGLTVQPTQTFTANATTDQLTKAEHGLQNGDQVLLTTTGTLPGGLALTTRYFVVNRNDLTFQLAATPNGSPVPITDAGSSAHSFAVVGSGQYLPQSTYAVGRYRAWIELVGSTTAVVPETAYGFTIEVVAKGN